MKAGATELVFLGSSGAIQVPAFHCSCAVCQEARRNPRLRRTRASVALLGLETVVIDACPELEFQLEREGIRQLSRIFITHWHYDHIGGLAALAEPCSIEKWPPVDIYLPQQVVHHFDQELAYMRKLFNIHPTQPGDRYELPDATWEVVKTTHTDHSVGFIVASARKLAYLVDGVRPPAATLARLGDLDLLVLEATLDELQLPEGERWLNFSLEEAVDCWKEIGAERCILTHLSCHSWKDHRLVPGLSPAERMEYEAKTPALTFAYDGMRLTV